MGRRQLRPEWKAVAERNPLGEAKVVLATTSPEDPDTYSIAPRGGSDMPELLDNGVPVLDHRVDLPNLPVRVPNVSESAGAFAGLQARANLYGDVLQVHVADLEATLAELTVSVESLLNQKAA